jgi:hypothetical protein
MRALRPMYLLFDRFEALFLLLGACPSVTFALPFERVVYFLTVR